MRKEDKKLKKTKKIAHFSFSTRDNELQKRSLIFNVLQLAISVV